MKLVDALKEQYYLAPVKPTKPAFMISKKIKRPIELSGNEKKLKKKKVPKLRYTDYQFGTVGMLNPKV